MGKAYSPKSCATCGVEFVPASGRAKFCSIGCRRRFPRPPTRTCSIDDCDRPYYGRGWCNTHWACWRRTGSPYPTRFERQPCSIDGCPEAVKARPIRTTTVGSRPAIRDQQNFSVFVTMTNAVSGHESPILMSAGAGCGSGRLTAAAMDPLVLAIEPSRRIATSFWSMVARSPMAITSITCVG